MITYLSSSISPYLCLPPPICSVNVCIQVIRMLITVNATLRGKHEIVGVRWLPHQPSQAFHDLLTPLFDRPLVIVISSHILRSVLFPLPKSLIIRQANHQLLDSIPIFESSETENGVWFHQQNIIVRLHALFLDSTLDIFVLFARCNMAVGIVL